MKKCFILLALMCAISFATPVSDHGKLSVDGRWIKDQNGNVYVLRGMSMYWNRTDWPGGKFYKQSTVNEIAGSNWNANLVRAAIGNGNLQDAKSFMDWTNTAGIYVIVDWHVHDMNLNSARDFFYAVAKHAKENGYIHVLYEIFNEPISQSWSSIKSDAENLIEVIRSQDPDGLIIVGTPKYSADIDAARENPISESKAKNVLYTFHFYSSDAAHVSYKQRVRKAWCNNFPVFVSEFGTSTSDGGKGTSIDRGKTDDWMGLIESMGLSWANWSLSDANESSAALKNGCCSGGAFNNSNLSESGQYIQNIMKKRNIGGDISSAGLTAQFIQECPDDPTTGVHETVLQNPKLHFFDLSGRDLLLQSGGDLEIYSLQGKRVVFFAGKQQGETISLQNLPTGAYIAVLRKSGQAHSKTIYLK